MGNELYGKKFTKLKMARKILEKLVDNAEARENKESASKNLLSQQKNEMDKHKETVKKTEEKSEKSHKAYRSAQRAKAHADNELERASNAERNSKHNALERTKKHEASAIRRAVEKKNKAGEIESKAYEKSAEQRKNSMSVQRAIVLQSSRVSTSSSKLGMSLHRSMVCQTSLKSQKWSAGMKRRSVLPRTVRSTPSRVPPRPPTSLLPLARRLRRCKSSWTRLRLS